MTIGHVKLMGVPSRWQIRVEQGEEATDFALWLRAAERIEVPAGGIVPGPLDITPPPRPRITPMITRPSPSAQRAGRGAPASGTGSDAASPAASPVTPAFSRSAAEAAAMGSGTGIMREESKLTTWGFVWSYASGVLGGAVNPAETPSPSAGGQVGPSAGGVLINGQAVTPSPTQALGPPSTQYVWLVALSGTICCEFGSSSPSPWAVYVYNPTTGAPLSVLYGTPSSSETWPPDFDSIEDLAS